MPPSSSALAWPCLREVSELGFHGRLAQVLRMPSGPDDEAADHVIPRGRRVGRTDERFGVRAREGRQVVVVGAHQVTMTEVQGLLVSWILGRDRAQVEEILGRLDLEVSI